MFTQLSLLAMVTAAICVNGAVFPALLAARQTTCSSTYTVVSGDTCDAIAVKNNVTVAALEAANPVSQVQFCVQFNNAGVVVGNIGYRCTQCDNLFVGESLCIPGTAIANSTCQVEFTVQSGDDCFDIAEQFNVTLAALETANPQVDPLCDNLLPGEVLCIPTAES